MNRFAPLPLILLGCSSTPSPPPNCGTQPQTTLYEDACHSPSDGPMFCFYETQSGF